MLNLGLEINKAIDIAKERSDFEQRGVWRSEKYNQNRLNNELQSANLTFTSSVAGMNSLSHQIEDEFATRRDDFHFYSAFQKISRLWPQEQRYRRLLSAKRPVYVFGIPDAQAWIDPNLHIVHIDRPVIDIEPAISGSPVQKAYSGQPDLSQNWFVIVNSPHYVSMALLARENKVGLEDSKNDKLLRRSFEGMWTHDVSLITELSRVIEQYLAEKRDNRQQWNELN